MMHVGHLRCVACGEVYPPDEIRYRCSCGASLDVSYDYTEIDGLTWDDLRSHRFDHARYRPFLPVVDPANLVTMGGGGTPLVDSTALHEQVGADLVFKLESSNPTGSFKDRGTAVELGTALDHGAREVVVASTGNMGASIAAYTARAGVDARIYVPDDTGGPKLKQMESHDADVVAVDGDYAVAAEQAWQDWEEQERYLMGDYPYRGEGEKTVGFEIADQLGRRDLSDVAVVLPVGNGTLLHAAWKAFEELEIVGLLDGTPRMIGVQAEGCNTVVNALQKGFTQVEPVDKVDTVAGAIACADPLDGDQALQAIQESGGTGIAVGDDAIMAAKQELAQEEGIYAEEAAAAAWAGATRLREEFDRDETVVLPVCGHGLKT
ncbi:MAG: threonine synthase [Candidatus Nanohaloarchaea archaeon]|nr:threonine synthase [Candidatus Nanohaloarchaea archaeon]